MKKSLFFCAGNNMSTKFTQDFLAHRGIEFTQQPEPDVTHLMLPIPSFESDGRIRGGGVLEHHLADLPQNVTVIGGNLHHPSLQGYHKIDLLQNADFLAKNCAITAWCAMLLAGQKSQIVFRDCPVLVIGWGRIGKCLSLMLKDAGCKVTILARKKADRAMAKALGFCALATESKELFLKNFRILFNTVPAAILSEEDLSHCHKKCVKIDLASQAGLSGNNVIWARGLPGKDAPESAGILIGETILQLLKEEHL